MNTASRVIDLPPRRATKPSTKPSTKPNRLAELNPTEDDLMELARDILRYDPTLAELLVRSGKRRLRN
jgi:hypothetical protein